MPVPTSTGTGGDGEEDLAEASGNDAADVEEEEGEEEEEEEDAGAEISTTITNIPEYVHIYAKLSEAGTATYPPRNLRTLNISDVDVREVNKRVGLYIERVYDAIRYKSSNPSTQVAVPQRGLRPK